MQDKIIKQERCLPVKLNDLIRFVLIGREKLVAVRAAIRAIDKLDIATGVREQKKEEATLLAGALLDAEARIGEILSRDVHAGNPIVSAGGQLPKGISRKQSSQFQSLAEHPDVIEQVKAEAIESDDLPTRTEVLRRIKEKERLARPENKITIPLPENEYEVIVIDPPWPYGTEYDAETRRVASPYPELSIKELESLKLPLANNCILWLWTTHKFIWEAKRLMDLWDFQYKLTCVWNKEKLGMGAWLRCQTEFCLLGIKGNPKWNLTNERDIITEARTKHSKKPIMFYEMVKKLTPDMKRINIFGRKKINGYANWGDEAEGL